ncbi:MAG: hypothetical protein JO280_01480 [Mycobacteriaceae bacterium]|nr:hypothetical protein [Mycobacteriaceae bacterium]
MTVYEVLTVILIAALALGTTIAIYVGLIGLIGGVYFVECAKCGHLTFSSSNQRAGSGGRCRHPVHMHPLHAMLRLGHAEPPRPALTSVLPRR